MCSEAGEPLLAVRAAMSASGGAPAPRDSETGWRLPPPHCAHKPGGTGGQAAARCSPGPRALGAALRQAHLHLRNVCSLVKGERGCISQRVLAGSWELAWGGCPRAAASSGGGHHPPGHLPGAAFPWPCLQPLWDLCQVLSRLRVGPKWGIGVRGSKGFPCHVLS